MNARANFTRMQDSTQQDWQIIGGEFMQFTKTLPDRVLAHFLDGLVLYYHGRDESQPPRPVETRITNNLVLKKLRVAFQLKDVDMHDTFIAAGFPLTKPELTALFRQPGHKHYRPCGDQILRNFLKGLTLRYRTGE